MLFVSHDMAAVSRLCHRIIWIDKGEVMHDGEPELVIAEYEDAALRGTGREAAFGEKTGRHTNVIAEIASVRLLNSLGEEIGAAPTTEDVYVRVRLKVRKPGAALRAFVDFYAKRFLVFRTTQARGSSSPIAAASSISWCAIPAHLLAETTYTVNVTVYTIPRQGNEGRARQRADVHGLRSRGRHAVQARARSRRGSTGRVQSHVNARKKRKSVV